MSNALLEFSQSASKLNKEKKYQNTLELFKEKKSDFSIEEIAGNEYLVSTIITALRHTNNCDFAFKFLEQYHIELSENTNERILNAYGWLLYTKYLEENKNATSDINNDDTSEYSFDPIEDELPDQHTDTLKQIIEFMPWVVSFENEFSYSVFSRLFDVVLKTESKRSRVDWLLINRICDLVTPDYLTLDCRSFEIANDGSNQKRKVELASDREKWYVYKSKALLHLGRYRDTIQICDDALKAFKKFHYHNDIWFLRRIAVSKKQMGEIKEAIKDFQKILAKKKEWFILKDLAILHKEDGDKKLAYRLTIESLNSAAKLEYKSELVLLLADLLKEKGEEAMAFKHYSFAKLIRQKYEWKPSEKIATALSGFSLEEIPFTRFDILLAELKKFWAISAKQ